MNPDDLCMGCLEERGNEKVCPRCQWEEGTPGASPLYLPPRTVLDNQYLLGRVLGHGGFGITYLAWDLTLHRRLAIKEYMPQGIAGRAPGNANVSIYTNEEDYQWGLERFLDEARVVAKFADHPNIMSIINHFADNETAYIVAEYLDGSTLLEYTENEGGTIPYETAARILMPVMDALREVHKSGILHRDISPDNVCITRAGLVKLLDFGAARQALGQKSKNLSVILKEGYAPEEQYRTKGDQGPWTDVYATAATLYRVITGKIPPPATDRAYQDELEPPSSMGVAVPSDVEANLLKALGVRAENRFQSMQEFQAALLGQSAAKPPPPPPPLPPPVPDPIPKPTPAPVPKPNPLLEWIGQVPKWMWAAGAAAIVILLLAYWLGPEPAGPSEAETPGVEPQLAGIWQNIWADGNNRYACRARLDVDGQYAYLSGCHPSIGNDQGMMRILDGTFRILSSSTGRTDSGTYRILSATRLEMSSTVNGLTTLWDRVPQQSAEPQPTPHQQDRQQPPPAPQGPQHERLTEQADEHVRNGQALLARPLLQQALEISPDYARAHALMGYLFIYYDSDVNKGGHHYRKAYDLGGTISFRLLHDLGVFRGNRQGTLEVSTERVLFRYDDGVEVFNTSQSSVREAKKNKLNRDEDWFHIETRRDNYNLAPTSSSGPQEVDLIFSFLPGS